MDKRISHIRRRYVVRAEGNLKRAAIMWMINAAYLGKARADARNADADCAAERKIHIRFEEAAAMREVLNDDIEGRLRRIAQCCRATNGKSYRTIEFKSGARGHSGLLALPLGDIR